MPNEILQIGQLGTKEILQGVTQNLPPEIIANLSFLITILKTLGIIFIVYLIFLIVNIIMNIRRNLMIKKMYEKINEIDKKLDKVLKKRK